MKRKIVLENIFLVIAAFFALAFVIRRAGPATLRLYVEAGLGNCQKNPVLCIAPAENIVNPQVKKEYLAGLLQYKFADMQINTPKEFAVVKEKVTKIYYKKRKRKDKGDIIYLLHKPENFFINLFPQLTKKGIKNDYAFFSLTIYARTPEIKNLTDTFFVVIKSIFTPYLGDQQNLKIAKFSTGDRRGFITYNLGKDEHYFDCNIFINQGDFFKVYIKDRSASLNLEKVLTIALSLKKTD